MWQYVIIGILCTAASSKAASSCNGTASHGGTCSIVTDPSSYHDEIYELIDVTLRNLLKNGLEPLPPLDPLVIEDLNLSLGEEGGTYEPLKLHLKTATVENILNYEVDIATFSITGFTLTVAINFTDISLNAEYDMDGWLGDGLLYLYGEGDIALSLQNVSLYVDLAIRSYKNNVAYLGCVGLDYNVGNTTINITGLLGGGELEEFFNQVLQDALPTILDLVEDPLLGSLTCLLQEKASDLLLANCFTLNLLVCKAVEVFCFNTDPPEDCTKVP